MKTCILIGTIATVLRAIARTVLVIAWVIAQGSAPTHRVIQLPENTVLAVPAAAPVAAPLAPEATVLEVEQSVAEKRPAKCGDLPRAPWNTCVALHDHEI